MTTLTASSPQLLSIPSSSAENKGRSRSSNGLPKELPGLTLVHRPHRFSDLGLASPAFNSAPQGPRSPGPFSPPLSATSFGTFIDSEPSTPAYSPRPTFDWDGSKQVLLKPMSPSMEPSSPLDPTWNMLDASPRTIIPKQPLSATRGGSSPKVLSPLSIRSTRSSTSPAGQKDIRIVQLSETLSETQLEDESKEDNDNEPEEEQNNNSSSMPLGRLASKMRTMLSRKASSDKKKSKKNKEYFDVEYLHDKHWTEM